MPFLTKRRRPPVERQDDADDAIGQRWDDAITAWQLAHNVGAFDLTDAALERFRAAEAAGGLDVAAAGRLIFGRRLARDGRIGP